MAGAARPRQLRVVKAGERPPTPHGHFNCPVYGCIRLWGPDTFTFDNEFLVKVTGFFERNTSSTEVTGTAAADTGKSTKVSTGITNVRRQTPIIDLIDSDNEVSNADKGVDYYDTAIVRLASGNDHQNRQCELLPAVASLPTDSKTKRPREGMQTNPTPETPTHHSTTTSMSDLTSVAFIPEKHASSSILAQLLQQKCPPSGVLCPAKQHQMILCSSGVFLSHGLTTATDRTGYSIKCDMDNCQQCWYVPMASAGSNLGNIHRNDANWEAAKAESRSLQEGELHTLFYHCFSCAGGFYICLEYCATKFPHLGTKSTVDTYLQELQSGQGRIDLECVVRQGTETTKSTGNESQGRVEEFVRVCKKEESILLARARQLRLAMNMTKQKNSI